MKKEELKDLLIKKLKVIDLSKIMSELRSLCANEKSPDVLEVLDMALDISKSSSNLKQIVDLYELKIKQLYHLQENLPIVEELLEKMIQVAESINYIEGLALSLQIKGYNEFLKGNREKSSTHINRAIELLKGIKQVDSYAYIICNYSFAVNKWLSTRDFNVASILEECVEYFYSNSYYHGLAVALGVLSIIYQQTQNKEKSMKLLKRIISDINFLSKMPREIQSIIHFYIGFSHGLCFNLNKAETHLLESHDILKSLYQDSIYSGYYLTALSHLTKTYALQGNLELALDQMKKVEELLEEEIAVRNLDSFNKSQIIHTFNLTKFYIQSRLHDFTVEKFHDLIQTIISNVGTYHSNAIMLSELLLSANFTKEELQDIRNLNNPSTKRVEHILDFLIGKESHDDKQTLQKINTLKRRPVEERMTSVEKAFADLLAAQEYYKINRFAEIYPLLKKYENQTHKIEVLEMRVFIEAFIQVGKFKNGDPLGPALQYMAIKKCRNYGFSRLENRLLVYLDMQRRDIQSPAI
ncbi:MAG: hypothetical protein ACTSVO_00560 [Candidatus Heimdallarchaeaceae archaeon]